MQYLFSVSGKRFFHKRKHKGVHEKTSVPGSVQRVEANRETILKNEFLTMSYDSWSGVLYQEWRGFCPGADFRASIDSIFNFITEKKIFKTICDVRYQRVVPPSSQNYVEEKVLDYIKNYGSFFTAFIAMEKSAGSICAELYDMRIRKKLGYRINQFFETEDEAEAWLSEK